jgi:predicted PurR-regulated permease PerM
MTEEEPKHVLPSKPTDTSPASADDVPEPVVVSAPVSVHNVAFNVMAALAVVLVLQYAQAVLIPVVLGVLISYGLVPLVDAFQRVHLPRAIGAAVAISLFVGTVGLGAYAFSDDAMAVVSSVPQAAKRLSERVRAQRRGPAGALEKMQQAAKEIDRVAQEAAAPVKPDPPPPRNGVQKVEVVEPSIRATDYLWSGGVGFIWFAGQFVLVLFLVYFFLVTGDLYKRKLIKIAGPKLSQKKAAVQILDDISHQIATFMRVQLFTSFIVSVATGLALWWFGVEQYVVWGLLAGIFNSIPYIGPVIVTAALGVVTFLQFNDPLKSAYICAVAFAITSLEGFLLTPMLMGRAAQMNPVAIFVGLLFWSWIWGIWGTILAVPLLMMLKAICDHVEHLESYGELLGE